MNRDEAKLTLSVYRPNGADAQTDFFREALSLAQRDPVLGNWIRNEQKLDGRIAAGLASITPPAQLRSLLLAAAPGPTMSRRWSRRWKLACGGLALLSIGLGVHGWGRDKGIMLPASLDSAQAAETLFLDHGSLGLISNDRSEVRRWLSDQSGPLPTRFPAELEAMSLVGAQVWRTSRGPVSLLCFLDEAGRPLALVVFAPGEEVGPALAGIDDDKVQIIRHPGERGR